MNRIFVYGLLKPGLRLHHVAEPFVTKATSATTKGRLYDAGVPAARFDEDGTIDGFVFELDEARLDEGLAVLDDLEDEGDEYRRIVITAQTPDGHFTVSGQINGLDISPLGTLWRPKFFTGTGIAFHGSPSVPPFPASHGCVRMTNAAIDWVWANNIIPLGTGVWVY